MMNPEEISRKANIEREKKKAPPTPLEKVKEPKAYGAFSFYVYSRIFPNTYNAMLWFLLCAPGLSFLMIYFLEEDAKWALYCGSACIIAVVVRALTELIRKLLTFGSYKNFTTGLGFELNGWDTLGSFPNQLKSRYWSKRSSVEILLKEHVINEQKKLVTDALFLFKARAGKKFYEAEIGGDGRDTWTDKETLKIYGSSNPAVISEMYLLVNVYLKSIQQKYHCIKSVNIDFDPDIFEVSPPPSTD